MATLARTAQKKLSPAGLSYVWDFSGAIQVPVGILFPLSTLLSGCCADWQLLGAPSEPRSSPVRSRALGAPGAALALESGTTLGARTGWDRDSSMPSLEEPVAGKGRAVRSWRLALLSFPAKLLLHFPALHPSHICCSLQEGEDWPPWRWTDFHQFSLPAPSLK